MERRFIIYLVHVPPEFFDLDLTWHRSQFKHHVFILVIILA